MPSPQPTTDSSLLDALPLGQHAISPLKQNGPRSQTRTLGPVDNPVVPIKSTLPAAASPFLHARRLRMSTLSSVASPDVAHMVTSMPVAVSASVHQVPNTRRLRMSTLTPVASPAIPPTASFVPAANLTIQELPVVPPATVEPAVISASAPQALDPSHPRPSTLTPATIQAVPPAAKLPVATVSTVNDAPRLRMSTLSLVDRPDIPPRVAFGPVAMDTSAGRAPNVRRLRMSTMRPVAGPNLSTIVTSPPAAASTSPGPLPVIAASGPRTTSQRLRFTDGQIVVTGVPIPDLTAVSLPQAQVPARLESPVSDSSSGSNSPADEESSDDQNEAITNLRPRGPYTAHSFTHALLD